MHPRSGPVRRAAGLLCLFLGAAVTSAQAATAEEIEARADAAIERLVAAAPEARQLMSRARAVLIFPRVIKAGIGVGGEYGEGVLRQGGESIEYYSTASASIGFQFGAQAKAQFLLFMTDDGLGNFRRADGWEVGVDASVTLVKIGAGGSLDTTNIADPVVAFVLADRGLMYDASLAGTKISRIQR
ncbi:MAG: YSC84-related protein [Pseudomonadales bacterium]|jgi:lipid-binding SYLF domain-containing protein|nr:YSC84-related protein [Pseudomonadales bacterium]